MSSESAEYWKSISEIVGVILLGATFIAGLGFWYFGRRVNEFQAERLRIFDRDLTGAKNELAKQQERAAHAEQGVADAKKDAADALRDAGLANKSAAEAKLKTEEIRGANLATETKLETERQTRLELEKSILPRELFTELKGGKSNFDPLKPFAGITVSFEVIPDFEAQRAARRIAGMVHQAGWNLGTFTVKTDLSDGVAVWGHFIQIDAKGDELKSQNARDSLIAFLESFGWTKVSAHLGASLKGDPWYIPADALVVQVGYKPNPYFEPPFVKEGEEKIRKMKEESKKLLEKFQSPPPK
jgi:hypothetical protein